jgi:hypothetical protein
MNPNRWAAGVQRRVNWGWGAGGFTRRANVNDNVEGLFRPRRRFFRLPSSVFLDDARQICDVSTPLGYPEGLQCTEVTLMNFEADIFQAAVTQVLQFSTVIMAFPAK